MPKITRVRPVLLTAPYTDPQRSVEGLLCLPTGYRTTGLVEITLDNGVTGLGEGYLTVFAPKVFTEIVDLVAPVLIGRDPRALEPLMRELLLTTGYWSLQGAAQHVISAIETALQDCRARLEGVPVWKLLGGEARALKLYASGGDAIDPAGMRSELDQIQAMGIDLFKMRARRGQEDKAFFCQKEGAPRGIDIAVDMTQNLAVPSQTIEDIEAFLAGLEERGGRLPVFLEEVLGPQELDGFVELKRRLPQARIAGGEIVTTAAELNARIKMGYYDIAQPDATVIGGLGPTLEVFDQGRAHDTEVYVHCWGGPVGMMANFHVALAGGGTLVEWPTLTYELRQTLVPGPWQIEAGHITLSDAPGLGIELTPEIEQAYPFREDATYNCRVDFSKLPQVSWV
jgi:L-alanine-DL-glutamate epimerase-like enolase superfamily enzyme